MKSKQFVVCLMMAIMPFTSVQVKALPVIMETGYVDPQEEQGDPHRGPVFCPNVDLDAHTLYLYNVGYDLTLVFLDEAGDEAYTTFISAGTSAVVLPATLSGDYEIKLFPGGEYYFYGWIEL